MIKNVNVCAVGQIQTGTSQQTGNQWRKQEFVVEWFENATDTQSQKVVLSLLNDNIEKLNVQIGDKMEVRFDLRFREYKGRYYMDVFAPFDGMKKTGGLSRQPAQENAPHGTTEAPTATKQNQSKQEEKGDDLPF